MVYASIYAEYNMDSVVELTFCSKNKEKKKGFYDSYILAYKSQMHGFYGIRFCS